MEIYVLEERSYCHVDDTAVCGDYCKLVIDVKLPDGPIFMVAENLRGKGRSESTGEQLLPDEVSPTQLSQDPVHILDHSLIQNDCPP